jgi:hypothetical protein
MSHRSIRLSRAFRDPEDVVQISLARGGGYPVSAVNGSEEQAEHGSLSSAISAAAEMIHLLDVRHPE